MTSHVHGEDRTMSNPLLYFATGATTATIETAPLSLEAYIYMIGYGFASPVIVQ